MSEDGEVEGGPTQESLGEEANSSGMSALDMLPGGGVFRDDAGAGAFDPTRDASLPLWPVPDDAAEGDDDLDVRLNWPSGVVEESPTVAEPPSAAATSVSGGDAAPLPSRGLLPHLGEELASLRLRVETIHQDVAGLVARVQTLGGAVTGVEVALGDRLSEYSDTVVQLGRGLTSNLSTSRETNDRSIADLRRALADSEELLRALLTKTDDLAVQLAAVRGDLTGVTPEDDALDVDDLRTVVREAIAEFDVRGEVARLADDVAAVGARITEERAERSLSEPAPSGVDAAVQAELLGALEAMRTELAQIRKSDARAAKGKETVEQERALVNELEAMREEIAALKRRIAVRAKSTMVDDDQIALIAERVSAALEMRLPDEEVSRLAAAVSERFTEAFEVVTDDERAASVEAEPEPAPAAPASRASKASSPRRR